MTQHRKPLTGKGAVRNRQVSLNRVVEVANESFLESAKACWRESTESESRTHPNRGHFQQSKQLLVLMFFDRVLFAQGWMKRNIGYD